MVLSSAGLLLRMLDRFSASLCRAAAPDTQGKAHLLQGRDVLSAVVGLEQLKAYVIEFNTCFELSNPAKMDSTRVQWDGMMGVTGGWDWDPPSAFHALPPVLTLSDHCHHILIRGSPVIAMQPAGTPTGISCWSKADQMVLPQTGAGAKHTSSSCGTWSASECSPLDRKPALMSTSKACHSEPAPSSRMV
jgi:hypothetical protein